MFDTLRLDGFKVAVNRWCPSRSFFSVFLGAGTCGVATAIYKQFLFPTWACSAGFNNNNNKIMSLNLQIEHGELLHVR